jgi:hypothetical protein
VPYSKRKSRGVLAGLPIDGRTCDGKFALKFERDLLEHIGGRPNVLQATLIRHLVRLQLQIDEMSAKLLEGKLRTWDRGLLTSLNTAFRMALRELGSSTGVARSTETIDEVIDGLGRKPGRRANGQVWQDSSARRHPNGPSAPAVKKRQSRMEKFDAAKSRAMDELAALLAGPAAISSTEDEWFNRSLGRKGSRGRSTDRVREPQLPEDQPYLRNKGGRFTSWERR